MCISSSYCAWHRRCLALVAISFFIIMGEKLLKAKVRFTTKRELKQPIWNLFGNVWFSLCPGIHERDPSWSQGDLHDWDLWRGTGLGWIDDVGMQWRLLWESLGPAVPKPRSLSGDHLTPSLGSVWSHMFPYSHAHPNTLSLTTEMKLLICWETKWLLL